MPLTPHMSPAAIGCSVVKLRGWPSASKRAPIASSIASGQPSADDDETVTIAPSAMRRAASEALRTFGRAIPPSNREIHGRLPSGPRGFVRRKRDGQRFDAVLARRGGRPTAGRGFGEQAHRAGIEVLVLQSKVLLALCGPQLHLALGGLG